MSLTPPSTQPPLPHTPPFAEADAASDAAIRDWAEKLKEAEAVKARMRPARETGLALDDLHRLRALGMEAAERNERQATGMMTRGEREAAAPGDTGLRFTRIARAVRQIVVLEQELMGLRAAPAPRGGGARPSPGAGRHPLPQAGEGKEAGGDKDRERSDLRDRSDLHDYDDLDDYDRGPFEQVVARVRRVLQAEMPAEKPPAQPGWRPRLRPAGPVDRPFDGPGWDDEDSVDPVATEARERGPPG